MKLPDALGSAVNRNRAYLGRKSRFHPYRPGFDRHVGQQFGPIADGGGQLHFHREQEVQSGVNNWVRTSTLTTNGGLGLNYLMKTGARVAMDLTTDFTRFTGNVKSERLAGGGVLTQPLLRGAGVLATVEPLRQDERTCCMPSATSLSIAKASPWTSRASICGRFRREAARNRYVAYQASLISIERDKGALAEANLRSQVRCSNRSSRAACLMSVSWPSAIRTYEDQMDDLKITMGLPVTERIVLDPNEMKRLEIIDPTAR